MLILTQDTPNLRTAFLTLFASSTKATQTYKTDAARKDAIFVAALPEQIEQRSLTCNTQ